MVRDVFLTAAPELKGINRSHSKRLLDTITSSNSPPVEVDVSCDRAGPADASANKPEAPVSARLLVLFFTTNPPNLRLYRSVDGGLATFAT